MDSPKTSLFLQDDASKFKDDVAKVLEFLVKDTTYATEVTNKELDLIKAHVDTVNSFIVVVRITASPKTQCHRSFITTIVGYLHRGSSGTNRCTYF